MNELICAMCHKTFTAKYSVRLYCDVCRKKYNSQRTMLRRKLLHPEIELGVGSGGSSKNKIRPITQYNYQKIRKSYCELCGATTNLCVHHKDGNRQNNADDNLITVCKRCYQQHHCKRDASGRYVKQK